MRTFSRRRIFIALGLWVLLGAIALVNLGLAGDDMPCPVWPAQKTHYLTEDELAGCGCRDLWLLRNEIFARHGRIFKSDELQKHFQSKSWYRAERNNADGSKGQNKYERANSNKILGIEKKWGCKKGKSSSSSSSSSGSSSSYCPNWPAQKNHYLSLDELSNCSCRELKLLRNEIYARHGRIFKSDDLQKHFQSKSWYRADRNNPDGAKGQNKYERANSTEILQFEKDQGCRK